MQTRSIRYHVTILLVSLFAMPAIAATIADTECSTASTTDPKIFKPTIIKEDYENNLFDDEHDVEVDIANNSDAASVSGGEVVKWDYAYKWPFKIKSDDKPDITVNVSHLASTKSGMIECFKFWFTNDGEKIEGTEISKVGIGFSPFENEFEVIDQEYESLKGITITDVHIEFKLSESSGLFLWKDADVYLEAGDLSNIPLPPAALSIVAPLLLLSGLARRKTKQGQQK